MSRPTNAEIKAFWQDLADRQGTISTEANNQVDSFNTFFSRGGININNIKTNLEAQAAAATQLKTDLDNHVASLPD